MARSDSCEVHSGTYKSGGTVADEDASGAVDQVDRSDCWIATVAALGYGPNIPNDGLGYGTAIAPAYLRGAEMNGSTDTWDSNGNKTPDSDEGITSYPVIFSGDADLDGTPKEPTSCPLNNTVANDAFYPLMWGCGDDSTEVCKSNLTGGYNRPRVDTDADGTFDTAITGSQRRVSYFRIKNIEATGYNGGPTTCGPGLGVRGGLGHFNLWGDGFSSGFVADGIYFHDNAMTNQCRPEHYCAVFGDNDNADCAVDHEIKNSNIKVDNRFFINDDCSELDECGCGWSAHDNRIELMSNPGCDVKACPSYDPSCDQSGTWCRKGLIRLKSTDSLQGGLRPKKWRIFNDEIINSSTTANTGTWPWLIHTECIGRCGINKGWGQFWFYGNILRDKSGAVARRPFGGNSCSSGVYGGDARVILFNNTFDSARTGAETTASLGAFCNSTDLEWSISRNNAFYRATSVNTQVAATERHTTAFNICTEGSQEGCTQNTSGRTGWFNGGTTLGTWDVGVNAGLANYVPTTGSPLFGTGSCDPDGDGTPGFDPDGNEGSEANITSWTDILGATINCASGTINIGAIQGGVVAPPAAAPSKRGSGTLGSGMIVH
jgi:hypothetical protein